VPEMPTDESKNNRDQDESRGGSVESRNEKNGEERRSSLTFPWPPMVSMVLMQRVVAAARRKMRLHIRRNDLFIVKSIAGQHIVKGVISVWICQKSQEISQKRTRERMSDQEAKEIMPQPSTVNCS
ncbi:hypothetical protein Tco_0041853, partial [Tanacetum coccineum]